MCGWSSNIEHYEATEYEVANLARGQLNREDYDFPVRVRA